MISLYSVLGKRTEIENLLRKMEDKNIELDSVTMNSVSRVRNKVGEMGVVKSLSKFDDVQGAQKMYGEWEQSSGGAEFDAKIPGGEMKIKRFMQNMVGVVLIICLVIALSMILHAAAADPDLAFSVAMLCLLLDVDNNTLGHQRCFMAEAYCKQHLTTLRKTLVATVLGFGQNEKRRSRVAQNPKTELESMISLQQHAKRILAHSTKPRLRLFCSNSNETLWASNQVLQNRIESALNHKAKISTVLEQWRQQGNNLNPTLVRGILEKLRDTKRLHSTFDLVENVLGFEEAEKFLEKVPENLRNESMYTSLLKSYAESGNKDVDRAEAAFKKMRELGLLLKPSPYSYMMSLYSSVGNRGKVDEVLREMKENNVKLDNLDMAKAYLRVGSKREAREMLVRAEELNDPSSYEELMRLYGEAGDSGDVYRIWNLYKKTREQDNDGFLALIESLLNLDDINIAAEMYYSEYALSGLEFDVRIPTMLASGFRKHGMVQQADILMNKTLRNIRFGNKPITPFLEEWGKMGSQVKPSEFRDLIKNLQDSNKLSIALEASSWFCDQKMINLFPEDYADRLDLTEKVLGLKEADKFFDTSIPETMKGYSVYTTLLNMYTRAHQDVGEAEAIFEKMGELGFLNKLSPFKSMISIYSVFLKRVEIDNLLRKMKEKNIDPDSVTMYNVLRVNIE
ncbi:unnamed protein product [Brassica napus]|uniref:(rape) hypothetical protein n=1 Tax=Brassica napus TaxID=3708 RepID=A0A816IDK3_BRANA|nr:unnamed protein product [Brassica napus]